VGPLRLDELMYKRVVLSALNRREVAG
jgi:hypothetical protein